MPVMVIVAIVAPEHAPVVNSAEAWVDVGKTLPHDLSVVRLPNFFFELRTPSGPLQIDRLVYDLLNARLAGPFAAQSPG